MSAPPGAQERQRQSGHEATPPRPSIPPASCAGHRALPRGRGERRGGQPDSARRCDSPREPHLRQLLRDLPCANGIQNDPRGVKPFHLTGTIVDLCHSTACARAAYDEGKMDGFLQAEGSNETFGYYDQSDIPYYWSLAQNYTLFDNYFTSAMVLRFRTTCTWWRRRTPVSLKRITGSYPT